MSAWITYFFFGSGNCTSVQHAALLAVMVRWERGLVCFSSLVGPNAGVVKRVVGVGGGARSARTFFFIIATIRIERNPPKLPSRQKSANPKTAFCGIVVFAESEISCSICPFEVR